MIVEWFNVYKVLSVIVLFLAGSTCFGTIAFCLDTELRGIDGWIIAQIAAGIVIGIILAIIGIIWGSVMLSEWLWCLG